MGPKGFPILTQLWAVIPVPLLYIFPMAPVFFGYCILVTLPFVKKGERREQFREMWKSFKTLGFERKTSDNK